MKLQEAGVEKSKVDSELETVRAQNTALKTKLQENLGTLESNANMIKWLDKQLNERQTTAVSSLQTPSMAPSYDKPPISKYAIPSIGMGATSQMSVAARSPKSMSFAAGAGSANNSVARVNNFMSPARSQASIQHSLNDSGFVGRDSVANQSVKVTNP